VASLRDSGMLICSRPSIPANANLSFISTSRLSFPGSVREKTPGSVAIVDGRMHRRSSITNAFVGSGSARGTCRNGPHNSIAWLHRLDQDGVGNRPIGTIRQAPKGSSFVAGCPCSGSTSNCRASMEHARNKLWAIRGYLPPLSPPHDARLSYPP